MYFINCPSVGSVFNLSADPVGGRCPADSMRTVFRPVGPVNPEPSVAVPVIAAVQLGTEAFVGGGRNFTRGFVRE